MNDAALQQKKLTLMFTDIVGYSRLMGRDQAQTIAMLEDYRRILVEQIDKHQGTVIEFIGDAVFARFDSAQSAVDAAIGIQKELFTFNHFRDKSLPRLQTRIGLHSGEVMTKGDAVFGDDVNIAARLEPIAVADGICISNAVYDEIQENLKEPLLKLGVQPLKNIETRIKAYLIRPLGITFKTRLHYANRKLNQKLGAYRYPIAAAVLLVIISLIYWVPRWLVPGYDANYVEIADFKNLMNAEGEVDYLSAGITEAVRSQLADVRDVYLVKTGEGILAPIMLEGSVQKVGDNLRIAYQLIRRKGNVQIAGGKLDGVYEDIFILQDRVTAEIAKYLAEEFGLPNFRPAKIDLTSDVLAYDYYMRGMRWLTMPSAQEAMDEAIKFFTTALVHDRSFPFAFMGLCRAYRTKYYLSQEINYFEQAEKNCSKAVALNGESTQILTAASALYIEKGDYNNALKILLSLNKDQYLDVEIVRLISRVYGLIGEYEKAEEIVQELIAQQPKNWHGYQILGLLYLRSKKYDSAIEQYKNVIDITPDNSVALSNIGSSYYFKGDIKKAANFFEKAVEVMPTSWGYLNSGVMFYYLSEFDKAEINFRRGLEISPGDFLIYLNLAEVQRLKQKNKDLYLETYSKSIDLAEEKININKKDIVAHYVLVISSLYVGNVEASRQYLEDLEGIDSDDTDVLYAKLRFLIFEASYKNALGVIRQLLDQGHPLELIRIDPDLEELRKQEVYKRFIFNYEK